MLGWVCFSPGPRSGLPLPSPARGSISLGGKRQDHKGPSRAPLLTGLCWCLELVNARLKFAVKYTVYGKY